MKRYVFDVDGTLTPSRGKMDPDFASWFEDFATHNACYLVTGSDRQKTLEQIPKSIYDKCVRVYQCSGNDVWEGDNHIGSADWHLHMAAEDFLQGQLSRSAYPEKTGYHFDHRPGLCNFSIVGRNATSEQRKRYVEWDTIHNERYKIATEFNERWSSIVATVAGETGIDIAPLGFGKDQVLLDLPEVEDIIFFGDKTAKGGNDHEIARGVLEGGGKVFTVNDWKDTYWYLQPMKTMVE